MSEMDFQHSKTFHFSMKWTIVNSSILVAKIQLIFGMLKWLQIW